MDSLTKAQESEEVYSLFERKEWQEHNKAKGIWECYFKYSRNKTT